MPALEKRTDPLDELERVAEEYGLSKIHQAGRFRRTMLLAEGLGKLRELMTPPIMARVMGVMNCPLGFLTDRDPARAKPGQEVQPYTVEVVRDCVIEAVLRGAQVVGNEMNIIATRTYLTKNFFARAVREFPGLTDLRVTPGIPRIVGDKGAVVVVEATWLLNGRKDSLSREFAIRVNFGQGADAITGKAMRKMLAAIYSHLIGSEHTLPEGEVGEEPVGAAGKAPPLPAEATVPRISAGKPEDYQSHPDERLAGQAKQEAAEEAAAPGTPPAAADPEVERLRQEVLAGLRILGDGPERDGILAQFGFQAVAEVETIQSAETAVMVEGFSGMLRAVKDAVGRRDAAAANAPTDRFGAKPARKGSAGKARA